MTLVHEAAANNADGTIGLLYDPSLGDSVRVTVILRHVRQCGLAGIVDRLAAERFAAKPLKGPAHERQPPHSRLRLFHLSRHGGGSQRIDDPGRPELRRLCRERQVELVEVDLRWGISEEQSTRKETLKLCLDEIRLYRPFFIGLPGERYGWTPGSDASTADLKEEQPWLKDLRGKSVTELEILHGVLNSPEMAGRSFFYLRDPAYAQARGADFLSEDGSAAGKHTNRLAEAEPLMRRALEILLKFTRSTGHPHAHWQVFRDNYKRLLEAMGSSEAQILAALRQLAPELVSR
jgi:hypothetical protein